MTVEPENNEPNEPNEFGFGGGATAPQPNRDRESADDGEDIAVPAGDLTQSVSDGIDDMTQRDDASR